MYEKFIQTKHLAVNFIQKFAHKYDLTSYYANIIVYFFVTTIIAVRSDFCNCRN